MIWAGLFVFLVSIAAVEPQPGVPPLARIKRIYVDQLGGGKVSDQMQDMIVTAIQQTGLYTITENRDNADAILKGSGDESVYSETHSSSDSIGLHASAGGGSSSSARTVGSSSRQYGSAGVTDSESSRSEERRREAVASVRLVDTDGDVIWSTTQESQGAKFRGSMADVADKIARKLAEETKAARQTAARILQTPPSGQ